jgi:hypothetical protein
MTPKDLLIASLTSGHVRVNVAFSLRPVRLEATGRCPRYKLTEFRLVR